MPARILTWSPSASIPAEKPELAATKKLLILEQYDRPGTEAGWHFLTGDQASIAALDQAIGFRYTFNPRTELYAHAAGVVIVTPDGRIARYFYGIDFPPKELQAELERAAPAASALRSAGCSALLRLRRRDRQVHALDHAIDPRPAERRRRSPWGRSCS